MKVTFKDETWWLAGRVTIREGVEDDIIAYKRCGSWFVRGCGDTNRRTREHIIAAVAKTCGRYGWTVELLPSPRRMRKEEKAEILEREDAILAEDQKTRKRRSTMRSPCSRPSTTKPAPSGACGWRRTCRSQRRP